MDIKGLTKYIRESEDIFEPIDIRDEIQLWRTNHGGLKKPKLLIDLEEFAHIVGQHDELGMILGGRFSSYNKFLTRFLEKIHKANAKPVFFLSGKSARDDLLLFIPQQEKKYIEHLKIYDDIEKNKLEHYLRERKMVCVSNRISSAFEWNLINICKKFGDLHVSFVRHNQEIVQYAQRYSGEVLAIVTNDTSFLAFEGEYQYWQSNEISLKELTGVRFNRHALFKNLDINNEKLQLLSALAGGMFLPFDQLQYFWGKLSAASPQPVRGRISKLALYASHQQLVEKSETNRVPFQLESIAYDVFGPSYTELELNSIYNSLMLFETDFCGSRSHKTPFIDFCRVHNTFLYFLITDDVYSVKDIEYVDYRTFNNKNFAQLIVPILMKLCGILYKDDSPRRPTRKICAKYAHDEPAKVVNEVVVYPKMKLPPTFELIFHNKDQSRLRDDIRWQLLAWVLDLDVAFVDSLRTKKGIDEYLTVILSLKFLLKHGEITTDEANIIISTEQEVRDDENSGFRLSRLKMPTKPDIRYVRIAHLYAYVYKWITYSLDTCGLHEKATNMEFDGPKFQVNMMESDIYNNKAQMNIIKALIAPIWCF